LIERDGFGSAQPLGFGYFQPTISGSGYLLPPMRERGCCYVYLNTVLIFYGY
jgi:hypothetical protein